MRRFATENEYTGKSTVLALGMFDGVHIAHQKLLSTAVQSAKEKGAESVALTFRDHPLRTLHPGMCPPMLTGADEKADLIEALGVDAAVLRSFTRDLADTEPEMYVEKIVSALRPTALIVGYNYTFGHRGRGNADLLARIGMRAGFEVVVLEPVSLKGVPVSSTAVRECLAAGDLAMCHALLGRSFTRIAQRVGSLYVVNPTLAMPHNGIYSVEARTDGIRPAIAEVAGHRIRIECDEIAPYETISIVFNRKI